MILSVIHPLGYLRLAVTSKLMTVEITYEILGSRTAEWTTRIDVADEHPLLLIGATNLQLHQVWAFPNTVVVAILLTERAFKFPVLQIIRSIDFHVLTGSQNHIPLLDVLVPEHVWVTEVWHIAGKNRISFIFGKGLAVICTVSHALCLVLTSRSVESHNSTLAQTSGIILIHNGRTAENGTNCIWLDRGTLELPMYQVGRCRMSPGHILPL